MLKAQVQLGSHELRVVVGAPACRAAVGATQGSQVRHIGSGVPQEHLDIAVGERGEAVHRSHGTDDTPARNGILRTFRA
ncbi:hypothetical protein [Nocardia harenae]|uniref:hypothetical protein n=1 Tax=Nocardia harenae TaxID=358707 RepID=UPI0012ED0F9C|nr:hypothetical protein [Nocardia harenae]